jgi:hypothetical protein
MGAPRSAITGAVLWKTNNTTSKAAVVPIKNPSNIFISGFPNRNDYYVFSLKNKNRLSAAGFTISFLLLKWPNKSKSSSLQILQQLNYTVFMGKTPDNFYFPSNHHKNRSTDCIKRQYQLKPTNFTYALNI